MPYFPLQGPKHPQLKFYTIMQDFKRVLEFNCKLKEIEQLKFFDLAEKSVSISVKSFFFFFETT